MELRFCEFEINYWANIYTKYQKPRGKAREQQVIGFRDGIQQRGYLTKEELYKVAYWKTRNMYGKAALTKKNPDSFIEEVTRQAFTSTNDWDKLKTLIRFKRVNVEGIGQPVASAILHHYDKDPYPILDPHALWSAGLEWKERNYYRRDLWLEYIKFCRDIADRNGIDTRTLDRALWRYSYLARAVLRALYELGKDTDWVRQDRVREKLDIPKVEFGQGHLNVLIFDILCHWREDNYALHLSDSGWRITELGKKSLGEQVNA